MAPCPAVEGRSWEALGWEETPPPGSLLEQELIVSVAQALVSAMNLAARKAKGKEVRHLITKSRPQASVTQPCWPAWP